MMDGVGQNPQGYKPGRTDEMLHSAVEMLHDSALYNSIIDIHIDGQGKTKCIICSIGNLQRHKMKHIVLTKFRSFHTGIQSS